MATSNSNTASAQGVSLNSRCEALGFWSLTAFSALKTLAGALAIIGLSLISVWLSYRLGELLDSGSGIFPYYPEMLALISLIGFYLVGYVTLKSINLFPRFLALLLACVIISLDLFAAWTIMCAADHERTASADTQRIEQLEANIAREADTIAYWDAQAKETSWYKSSYKRKAERASEKRDAYQAELDSMKKETFTAARAVFYRSPIFNDDPEGWMAIMRIYVAVSGVLVIFLGSALVTIHVSADREAPSPSPNGGNRRKNEGGTSTTTTSTPAQSSPNGTVTASMQPDSTAPNVVQFNCSKPTTTGVSAVELPVESISKNYGETVKDEDLLYQITEYLIRRGQLKPSWKSLVDRRIGGTKATAFLDRLRSRKVIKKTGNRHVLIESKRIQDGSSDIDSRFESFVKVA